MANSGTRNGAVTVTDAATSRTNLGLGNISTVNSPLPVANGGTAFSSALTNHSIFYGVSGSFSNSALTTNGGTPKANVSAGLINVAGLSQSTGITITNGANTISITGSAATTTTRGSFTLATSAEAVTGTDANKMIVPSSLTARLAAPGTIGGTTMAAATFTVLVLGTVGGVQFLGFSGDPNGSVTAPKGSWCTNIGTPAGLTDRVFVNTDGGTTWTGITSVA